MLAGLHWTRGENLYSNWRGFIYSPLTAAFFAPFSWLPPALGYSLWLVLNAAALIGGVAALFRTNLFPRFSPKPIGIVYLLLLPLGLGNLDVGQANPLVIGLLMFAIGSVRIKCWNTAALCVAIATFFKIYPLAAGMLICVIAPRRFVWRLVFALLLLTIAPFLFQHWSYVSEQYHAWIETRISDNRCYYPVKYVPVDLWFMLHWVCQLPIQPWLYSLFQVGSGAAVAVLCTWALPIFSGTAAAGGIALINSIGNLAGFAAPYAMGYLKDATGGFTAGLLAVAFFPFLSAILVLILGHNPALERGAIPEGAH
jgi:hypothetical protein